MCTCISSISSGQHGRKVSFFSTNIFTFFYISVRVYMFITVCLCVWVELLENRLVASRTFLTIFRILRLRLTDVKTLLLH